MIHVFIDTNIFLRFFHFTDDHLNKLDDLIELQKEKKIKIYITRQIVDEFNRRREDKIKDVLIHIKDRLNGKFTIPTVCQNMKEIKSIKYHLESIKKTRDKLYNKLLKQIDSKRLKADKLIKQIFNQDEIFEISEHIFTKSKRRMDLGNPPGKNGSYGDAINWEILLEKVPRKKDIYLITADSDFLFKIDDKEMVKNFLQDEWKNKSKAKVVYYRTISSFLKDKFSFKITEKEVEEEENIDEDFSIMWSTEPTISQIKADSIKKYLTKHPGKHNFIVKVDDRITKTKFNIDWDNQIKNELAKLVGDSGSIKKVNTEEFL